jgi:hypothetical protein
MFSSRLKTMPGKTPAFIADARLMVGGKMVVDIHSG